MPWGKARGFSQNGGYIVAFNHATGQELWVSRVYEIRYEKDIKDDKQDAFITSLKLNKDGRGLDIENERGQRFYLDIGSRKVIKR